MPRSKAKSRLHRHVRLALEQSGLSDKLLIVAVSGGPDSLALLYALNHLRRDLGLSLHGAHLDHRLRGEASRADAEFVARTFADLRLPSTVEGADVAYFRRQRRLSPEEAAREVRYAFLSRVAGEQKADALALGHTADDQAETVLMHIIRGSGLTGLRGMEVASRRAFDGAEVTLFRPLLGVSRQETLEYCRALGLEPRQDQSNLSAEPRRNRIRQELLPLLEQFNPAIRDALLRLSRSAGRDLAYLEHEADKVWNRVVEVNDNAVRLDVHALEKLAPSLQARLLRRAVYEAKGRLEGLEQVHVEDMLRLLSSPAGSALDLPGGVRFQVGYGEAIVAPVNLDDCPLPPLDGPHRLVIPGETTAGGWRVSATLHNSEGLPRSSGDGVSCVGHLDYGSVGSDLSVRSRIPGDRFQPQGMPGSRKLQDFMVDAKIPRHWRDRVPLAVSPRGIVWVVGWRVAEWAHVSDETSQVLKLRFEALQRP